MINYNHPFLDCHFPIRPNTQRRLLARHVAVWLASARHLTHFSFIPTSGAVCLRRARLAHAFIIYYRDVTQSVTTALHESIMRTTAAYGDLMIVQRLWNINPLVLILFISFHLLSCLPARWADISSPLSTLPRHGHLILLSDLTWGYS